MQSYFSQNFWGATKQTFVHSLGSAISWKVGQVECVNGKDLMMKERREML